MMRTVSLFLQPWEGDVSPNDGRHIPSCQPYLSGCFPSRAEEGQMDRQPYRGQAAGGIQKQIQLPVHLLSPEASGIRSGRVWG